MRGHRGALLRQTPFDREHFRYRRSENFDLTSDLAHLGFGDLQLGEYAIGEVAELVHAGRRDLDVHPADAQKAQGPIDMVNLVATLDARRLDFAQRRAAHVLECGEADQPVGGRAHLVDRRRRRVAVDGIGHALERRHELLHRGIGLRQRGPSGDEARVDAARQFGKRGAQHLGRSPVSPADCGGAAISISGSPQPASGGRSGPAE
jgi:hypothetical protein